jgi:hypothetical protein
MKYNKIFRTLALTVILSLLVIAIPATPALAAESLKVSPTKGAVGDKIDVTGSDYDEGEKVYIYFSSLEADEGDDIEDLDVYEEVKTTYADALTDPDPGDIDTYFSVPDELTDGSDDEDVQGGDYFVYTTYTSEGEIVAIDEFTVTGITISPTDGPVGTEVEIDGVGFDDREDIEISYDGDEIDIASGDDKTDSKGEFELTIEIPESTAGDHTITADVHGDEAEADFTVEPEITVSPTSGSIGNQVTVNGTGFSNTKDVTIYFNDVIMTLTNGTARTDSDGSFDNLKFNVPAVAAGTYNVKAKDTANKTDTKVFTIICNAEIDPATGNVGTELTVSGTGFVPGRTATIKYDGTEITTAPIGTDGAFEATFDAPISIHGAHTVNVSDGTNTKNLTFTMESTPPSTVYPQLPLTDNKLSGWKFDWCGDADDPTIEVTDDSLPITYTLQVASDIEFTTMVLEVPDLTTSEYTVTTKEEKVLLKSSTKQAPYYWHVKAIDAASNETDWTETRTFYVGFTWPSWATYTLIGLGGLLLLLLSFWLGRRTAYY